MNTTQQIREEYKEQVGYNTEKGSDKEYRINVLKEEEKWKVLAFNGPRGRATRPAKNLEFTSFDEALINAEKLKVEKQKGHYIFEEATDGLTPASSFTRVDTGLRPHLLNAIDEKEVDQLIEDNAWLAQLKYNGENLITQVKSSEEIQYANRMGYSTTVPILLEKELYKIGNATINGEILGDTIAAFDLLSIETEELREEEYEKRYDRLKNLLGENKVVFCVETAKTTEEKKRLKEKCIKEKWEGLVFKRKDSKHYAGKNKQHKKWKNWKSASCIVIAKNKNVNSVQLGVFNDNGEVVFIGNGTLKAWEVNAGDVLEVKYQDWFPGGGITQAELLMKRNDITSEECSIRQLESLKKEK